MKILFPTDYSNAAENAFVYALKLAELLDARITVAHFYEVLEFHSWVEETMNTRDVNDKITIGEFEKFRDQSEILKRIAKEHHASGIEINYSLKEADTIVSGVLEEAKQMDADMIVIGTKGAHGLREIFFGSVASKVMESAQCPVFIVPDTANYRGLYKIGLTLEYKPGELELIEQSLALARKFGGHLHCLHVDAYDPDKVKVKIAEYASAFKNEPDITFHTHYDLDVEKGILEYIKANLMDVLIMRVHQRNLIKDLFSYSIARRVAYHSDVPLIALHINEKERA